MAILPSSLFMRKSLLIRQLLPFAPNLRARDCRPGEIGNIELVEIIPSKRHVGRAAETDSPTIPRQQRFLSCRGDTPDFVRGITADVKISFRIEREAVGKATARRCIYL